MTAVSPDHPSFHVVTFSLPGYGFSEAPQKKGFAGRQYAEVGNNLMKSLGYEEYGEFIYFINNFQFIIADPCR